MSDLSSTEEGACRNCGCPEIQRFCPRCGQEDTPSALPVRQILAEFLADLLQFDAKIWITLRALIARPGFLTREYLDGRRVRYLSPLKLYLAIGFLSFLLHLAQPQRIDTGASGAQRDGFQFGYQMVAGWAPRRDARRSDADASKEAAPADDTCQQKLNQRAAEERQRQRQAWLAGNQSSLGIARIPLYALLFALFFRRQRRLYMEHLVFTLHLQSAVLLVEMAGRLVGSFLSLGGFVATLASLFYFFRAARGMYEETRGRVFWAMAGFYGLTSAVDALAGVGAGIIYQLLPEV